MVVVGELPQQRTRIKKVHVCRYIVLFTLLPIPALYLLRGGGRGEPVASTRLGLTRIQGYPLLLTGSE